METLLLSGIGFAAVGYVAKIVWKATHGQGTCHCDSKDACGAKTGFCYCNAKK